MRRPFDGIKSGMVVIGDMSDKIPDDVKKEAMAIADGIASGINNRKAGSGKKGILMLAATATVLPFISARTICMRRFRPLLSLT